jgi:hypothetical protein
LCAARDSSLTAKELMDPIRGKLLCLIPGASAHGEHRLIVAAEMAPMIEASLSPI